MKTYCNFENENTNFIPCPKRLFVDTDLQTAHSEQADAIIPKHQKN